LEVVNVDEQSLYSAYFIASFGTAVSCIFMFYRRMVTCDLLCITFLVCIFGITLVGAVYFSFFGVQTGILFTLITSIFLPWGFAISNRLLQGYEKGQIFQIIFGGILCLSGSLMSKIIGHVINYFESNLTLMPYFQWFIVLFICTLIVGLGGVLICINSAERNRQ
jgi:hypothetical protein